MLELELPRCEQVAAFSRPMLRLSLNQAADWHGSTRIFCGSTLK
jgi:hypothetical protein